MGNANTNVLQQSILEAVDTIVSRRVKDAAYDKTITGTINSLVGIKNKKSIYKINYGNGFFNATVLNDEETYIKNTPVYIFIPQGDFSKEKIILGRASNINTDLNLNITNAVLNNFSIVGKNNLTTKTKNIGLRSYHDMNEEKIDPTTFSHRIQILYNEEDPTSSKGQIEIESLSNLKRYLSEGSAIMLKADFRTDLSLEQKRQATGRYGLIFELLFDNEKSNWGSTQEEILKNVCEKKEIKAKTEFGNEEEEKSFLDYVFNKDKDSSGINTIEDIMNNLDEDNFEDYISGEDSQLKRIISELTALYATYVKNSPEKNQEIVQETITSFLKMLQDLVEISTSESIISEYNDWLKTEPNLEKEKKVYLQLDSNSMVGAPLYFKNWTSQHEIFKIDNLDSFKRINKILFFKTGFIQNKMYDEQKTEDIFVKDIGFYVLKPLDSVSGDYSLKVEAEETGAVVSKEKDKAIFKGSFYRKLNDLSQNLKLTYYWFKENPSVVVGGEKFNRYGGVGWELVSDKNENSRYFETEFNENPAAKNSYKCVAVFSENSETEIVIVAPFIVYNSTYGHTIELTSDQGTVFQFSSGTPIITCLIDGEEKNLIEDKDILKFYWSVVLENEEEIPFYSQIDLENLSINNIENYQFQDQYFNNVKFYKLEENKPVEIEKDKETGYIDTTIATRLMYPMINLKSDEKIKVKCVVIKNDSVTLGNAELEFENRGGALVDGYHIEFENDNQIFQYDEYGNSPKLNKLDPLEVLPIKAKLISPSGSEFSGSNVQVDWIFNLENSMIIPLGDLTLNSATGNMDTVRNETLCYFDIKSIYDPNAINNQIMCHINFNDQDYYKETNLFFTKIGENGTNGTDIAVRITPVSSNSILDTQALTLYTFTDKDENGKEEIKGFLNEKYKKDDDKKLSTSIQLTKAEESGFQVNVYQKGKLLPSDKYQSYWNLAGNPSETMISKGKNFDLRKESETNTYHLSWDSTKNNPYQLQIIKSHIKFSDKITTKDDDGNEIETETNKKEFYGYYPLPIIYFKDKKDIATYANNRLAINKNSYLKEVTYNADGRNPIYNHNQGLKIINIPENSRLIITAKGGWNDEEDDPDFLLLQQELNESGQIIQEPVKEITIEDSNKFDIIYILPNDSCTGSKTNNRIEIKIYKGETTSEEGPDIIISAPIIFTLNTFGLASLNAWDGNSVTIDEEDGYIMAPQIGAGEKDNNNRFTGIVMGKTETYTGGSENKKQIGLFGYSDGLQSIFLDAETGNATFGLPDVENGHYINSNREASDNYQEGRIELRPGGTSTIGGWKIGRKSLYYTEKGTLGERNGQFPNYDYVLKKDGIIEKDSDNLYGRHHDKDIAHDQGGILFYGGEKPYISIKSSPLNDVSSDSDSLLVEGDSLELQLDPNTPTLFTIFRHNGKDRYRDDLNTSENLIYKKDTRTFLAGINSRGEFVANSIGNKNVTYNLTNDTIGENIASKFYFNSLSAFDDYIEHPTHIGFQMTAGNKNLGQFFMSLEDIKQNNSNSIPTLHISGGNELNNRNTDWEWGEYLRKLHLHGREIALYVPDENLQNKRAARTTDANILLSQDKSQIRLSENSRFLLSTTEKNLLKTAEDLEVLVGKGNTEAYSTEIITIQIDDNTTEDSPKNSYGTALYYELTDKDDQSFYLQQMFEDNNSIVSSNYYYISDTDNPQEINFNNTYYQIDSNNYISVSNYNIPFYKYEYSQDNFEKSEGYIEESILINSIYERNNDQYSLYPIENINNIKNLNKDNYYFSIEKNNSLNYYKPNAENLWYVALKDLDLTKKNDKYEWYSEEDENKYYFRWKNNQNEFNYVSSFNFSAKENWYKKNDNYYYQIIDDNIYYRINTDENATRPIRDQETDPNKEIPIYISKNSFKENPLFELITTYELNNQKEIDYNDYLSLGYVVTTEATEGAPFGGIANSSSYEVEAEGKFDQGDTIFTLKEENGQYTLKYEDFLNKNFEELLEEEIFIPTYKWKTYIVNENGDPYILFEGFYFRVKDIENQGSIYYKAFENEEYCDETNFENAKEYYIYKNDNNENIYIEKENFSIEGNEPLIFVHVKIIDEELRNDYILLDSFEKENYYSIKNEKLSDLIGLDKIYLKEINNINQKFNYISSPESSYIEDEEGTYYQTLFTIASLFYNFYSLNNLNLDIIYVYNLNTETYIEKSLIPSSSLYFGTNKNELTNKNQYKQIIDYSTTAITRYVTKENWESRKDEGREYVQKDTGDYYQIIKTEISTQEATFPNKTLLLNSQILTSKIGQQINSTAYMLNLDIGKKIKTIPSIDIKNYNMPVDILSYNRHFSFSVFDTDNKYKNGYIAINPDDTASDTKPILGIFCATTNRNSKNIEKNGLVITEDTSFLRHTNNLQLSTDQTILIKSNNNGNEIYYNNESPQILIQAGDSTGDSSFSRLIMNSSNSKWSGVNFGNGKVLVTRPLICMEGRRKNAGLYPTRQNGQYDEIFWVNAKQYNNESLLFSGGVKQLQFTNGYKGATDLEKILDNIYDKISKTLTLSQVEEWAEGWAARKGFISAKTVQDNYAVKGHTHDEYAKAHHTHKIRLYYKSIPNLPGGSYHWRASSNSGSEYLETTAPW